MRHSFSGFRVGIGAVVGGVVALALFGATERPTTDAVSAVSVGTEATRSVPAKAHDLAPTAAVATLTPMPERRLPLPDRYRPGDHGIVRVPAISRPDVQALAAATWVPEHTTSDTDEMGWEAVDNGEGWQDGAWFE